MREKSVKNFRKELRENGVFYTQPELAKKMYSYIDIEVKSVYDPTCGAGNLLRLFSDDVKKYGQELDAEQLALVDIPNFKGYAGDTLTDDGFKEMKFDCIIANPPFSIKCNSEELKGDIRFFDLPLPSKADWVFMLHILHHLSENGVAIVLVSPGILFRGQKEGKVRKWFIENNYIERIVHVPSNAFEDTKIMTCIVVLRKNRKTTDIIYEKEEKEIVISQQEIIKNNYQLSVDTYIPCKVKEVKQDEYDIEIICKNIVESSLKQIETTFQLLLDLSESMKNKNFYIEDLKKGLEKIISR